MLFRSSGFRTENGKVKSRLGDLAYRPGWHLSPVPLATHIGVKDSNGNIVAMHSNNVWCLVEYRTDINYQDMANRNGFYNGKLHPRDAQLREVPVGGYYHYKTNPRMFMDWIIAGEMKIIRVLSDDEVAEICKANGVEPMPRISA